MGKVKIYIEETDETFELNVEGSVSKVAINTNKGIYSIAKSQEKRNIDDITNILSQFKHKSGKT